MVDFAAQDDGLLLAEGHDHDEDDLRAGVTTALIASRGAVVAELHAAAARIDETWFSDEHGYGHDCALHQDVPKAQWSPGCGTFRPVTTAVVPVPAGRLERAAKVSAPVKSSRVKRG